MSCTKLRRLWVFDLVSMPTRVASSYRVQPGVYCFHAFDSLCILVSLRPRLTEFLDCRDSQRIYDLSEEGAITHSDFTERPAIVFPEGTPYSTRYYGD